MFREQNALTELKGLHELFESSTSRLRVQPTNLDHLSESWNLLEARKKDVSNVEAKVTTPSLASLETNVSLQNFSGLLHRSKQECCRRTQHVSYSFTPDILLIYLRV